MTTTNGQSGFRAISLEDLQVSNTGSQAERRKHFDKAALAELADSIKELGLISPIIARPVNGHFEVVAGERRFIAAKAAGLSAITVDVRTLTDEQVLEIQLVENLQREGLHELAEAEGYEGLQELGHSADEIADKVGKSKGYVYSRLKLCALTKASRTAFYDGKLTASTALLLARIPTEGLQLEALKEITAKKWGDEVMSFREASSHIRDHYMTNLSDAGFPTEDATLVPASGACGACPKRTGNQAELFGDIKSGNVCTDPVCFKAKRQAHAERAIATAKDMGQAVITGKDAKKIMPWSHGQLADGFKKLTDKCYDDKKQRTYGQLLGKEFTPTLVQDPESGILIKVVPPAAVKEALKTVGVSQSASRSVSNEQSAAEKKAKIEKKFRAAVYGEMRDKFPSTLGPEDLRSIALRFYYELQHDVRKLVMGLWQLEPVKSSNGYGLDLMKPVEKLLEGLDDAQLTRFLFDLVFIKDLQVHTYSNDKPTLLLSTAKKLKVNADKIRAELAAAAKPAKKTKGKKK
jgi:ParB/RepB/Spo0J family partition protein